MNTNQHRFWIAGIIAACGFAHLSIAAPPPQPAPDESATSSLLANTPAALAGAAANQPPHALRAMSLFAITPPTPRTYQAHDLVQIIVRETSQAKSSQDLETKKKGKVDGKVGAFPAFSLQDLMNLQIEAGRTTNLPALQLDYTKNFKGEGDYLRKDDLSARLTAEVIEVLPNGNLVLEARTGIKTDDEESIMKVTGMCRPDDITAANTVLSNQIHDLMIEKVHKGELRENAKKGIIAKVLETIFAF